MSTDILDKPQAEVADLAVPIIKANTTWDDMIDVFNTVMATNVDSPIEQLERIRFISASTDDPILATTARLLGFDLSQDVLNLNADNLAKVVTQLSMYPDQNGTQYFTKFIDLVLNANTEIVSLYTEDYLNFYEQPKGALLIDGGTWFKTTHISLSINLFSLATLNLSSGETLFDRVKELFYTFAPVALVIDRTDFSEIFADEDWLGGSAFGIGAALGYDEVTVVIE